MAVASCERAPALRRTLGEDHLKAYLPDVSMTDINLHIFYLQSVPISISQGFRRISSKPYPSNGHDPAILDRLSVCPFVRLSVCYMVTRGSGPF